MRLALCWELARQYDPAGATVRAEDLAAEQAIPVNYLVQILIELKSAPDRWQPARKGRRLFSPAPPVEITLGQVLRAIHGQLFDTPALSDPGALSSCARPGANFRAPLIKPLTKSPSSNWPKPAPTRRRCNYI